MSRTVKDLRLVGIGEVLWDLLPGGAELGGAPTNFVYHAHALGAQAQLISRIGADERGREIRQRLEGLGLSTETLQVDPEAPTGTVTVTLSGAGMPHFVIHDGVAWDRIQPAPEALAAAARADAICFGSLAQRSAVSREALRAVVAAAPATAWKMFDINLRQQFFSLPLLEESLELATALKLNDEELPVLAQMFRLSGDERSQVASLARRFGLGLVALTRGARGSLLFHAGRWSENPGLKVAVVDTVGAGDAFTAALCLGLLCGLELDAINAAASAVAAAVCTRAGGTPPLPESLRRPFAGGEKS